MIKKILILFFYFLFINNLIAEENIMIMKLKDGDVVIELFDTIAPNHVKRFKKLSDEKKYNGVAFHRVIEGFMAQSGDVKYVPIFAQIGEGSLYSIGGAAESKTSTEFGEDTSLDARRFPSACLPRHEVRFARGIG